MAPYPSVTNPTELVSSSLSVTGRLDMVTEGITQTAKAESNREAHEQKTTVKLLINPAVLSKVLIESGHEVFLILRIRKIQSKRFNNRTILFFRNYFPFCRFIEQLVVLIRKSSTSSKSVS